MTQPPAPSTPHRTSSHAPRRRPSILRTRRLLWRILATSTALLILASILSGFGQLSVTYGATPLSPDDDFPDNKAVGLSRGLFCYSHLTGPHSSRTRLSPHLSTSLSPEYLWNVTLPPSLSQNSTTRAGVLVVFDSDGSLTLFAISALYPCLALTLLTYLTRPKRKPRPGHCPTCNYDLRASPARCPECGTVPAAASTQAPAPLNPKMQ